MKDTDIYNLCKKIQPIYRSITGAGNQKTLKIFKKINPKLKILHFNSGKKVFDWKIPKVWSIKDAWIKSIKTNKKIITFKENFLSVMGYSQPINRVISNKELKKKIYSLKSQPNATPYVTSYYKKDWAFCMSENKKKKLKENFYKIFIDSKFQNGSLPVGEIYIPGRSKKEILLTTYICHPQMASNELSGPAILIFLSKWIEKIKKRKYSYRILFSSETIGTISYIHKKLHLLKKNVIGGYVLTCLGDNKTYSYLKSKSENSLSDKIALQVMNKKKKKKIYRWAQRGSDERQFNSPGVELDLGSLMRSKYETFKEYHTSEDSLGKFVNKKTLNQSFKLLTEVILKFENSIIPITKIICEPHLSKRNLHSHINIKGLNRKEAQTILDFLSYSNGKFLLKEIANKIGINNKKALKLTYFLKKKNLIDF
jgi:aminopeptidase-like protein